MTYFYIKNIKTLVLQFLCFRRLEADNMLLAKSIETRNRKSRPRDLKNDSGQNSNDGIRKSKICRKNN